MGVNSYLSLIIAALICCVSLSFCDNGRDGQGTLIFAHIIFRHGDRTPVETYPNDPWKDRSYWPEGFGQLTNIGKQQHFQLGQYLHRRYQHLLNDTSVYSKDIIYVQSTDVDRTLMSAESNLAGLFPPSGEQVWNSDLSWQPIPVHTIPERLDYILAAKKPCARYDYALKKYKKSDEHQALLKKFRPLFQYLQKNSGKKVDSFTAVNNLYNTLYIEELKNRTLPDWTKKVYPNGDMQWISQHSFVIGTATTELKRLKSGFLLRDILTRFTNKTLSKLTPDRSLYIYSGHDTTIASFLNTLGVFDVHNPPYTACIMFELRKIDLNYFVQIFYRNSTIENPQPLNFPGCGPLCPLKKVIDLYNDVLPDDFESECKISLLSMTYEEANFGDSSIGFIVFGSIAILILLLMFITWKMYRQYNYHDPRWYLRIDT